MTSKAGKEKSEAQQGLGRGRKRAAAFLFIDNAVLSNALSSVFT